jgi:hypothetical protein
MRFILLAASLASLAACGQEPAGKTGEVASQPPNVTTSPSLPTLGVDGWEIDMTAYGRIGSALPAFAGNLADGAEITTESLRGRWTIIGVWADDNQLREEANFVSALHSAVGQDPDLDFLMIHHKVETAPVHEWPTLMDDGALIGSLALPASPAYLLVGPDLTIEGYRGALTATPDDGIKSVIRGVADIRKQVAAPQ